MTFLTIQEAAPRARVSPITLARLIKEGNGPAVTQISPRRNLIVEEDLEAWLRSRRQGPAVES